jgi:hypothetical protein
VLSALVRLAGDMLSSIPAPIRRRLTARGLRIARGFLKMSNRFPISGSLSATVVDVHTATELSSARARLGDAPVAPFRLLRSGGGVYTGRMIHVKGPVDLRGIGIDSSDVVTAEATFRDWFDQKGVRVLEDGAYENPEAISEDYMKELVHEFVHWLCFRQTSMATLIDMISWRLRFDLICLCELFHLKTGLPRLYEPPRTIEEAHKLIEKHQEDLRKLARDETAVAIFSDLVTHQGFTVGFYPRVIGPIIEPATWALVEGSWTASEYERNRALDRYFSNERSRSIASDILDHSMAFLRPRGAQTRKRLIETVNQAVNMPLVRLRAYVRSGDLEGLQTELLSRFEKVLVGQETEQATAADRSFAAVIQYLLTDKYLLGESTTDLKTVDVVSRLLAREREVSRYVIQTFSQALVPSQPQSKPTVFLGACIGQDYVTLRYDPFAGLTGSGKAAMQNIIVGLTGKKFNTLEDLVGDKPLSMRTALMILLYVQPKAENSQELLNDLGYPLQFLRNNKEPVCLYKSVTNELREMACETRLWYPELDFYGFLRFWLHYVSRMGVYASYLQGIHGMWI